MWDREKEGDGMTAGWMVGDGWNNGAVTGVPVCDVGRSDATRPQFAGRYSLHLWPGLLCLVWLIYNNPWDKKYKYPDAKQNVCFTYVT